LEPLLAKNPQLTPVTLFEKLQKDHPGEYPDSRLRTLQRRVSKWKALYGPEKEVMFRQEQVVGRIKGLFCLMILASVSEYQYVTHYKNTQTLDKMIGVEKLLVSIRRHQDCRQQKEDRSQKINRDNRSIFEHRRR
jgi:hypothetical protein